MADEVPPKETAPEATTDAKEKELSEEDLKKAAGGYTFGGPVPIPGKMAPLDPVADLPGPIPNVLERRFSR